MDDITQSRSHLSVDYQTLFEFGDEGAATSVQVSLATLLQCLCIAEARLLVPPLDKDWVALTVPPALREHVGAMNLPTLAP